MPVYEKINKLIDSVFKEDFTIKKIENKYEDINKFNFLNIINKEYEETVYTNMFEYYFNKKIKDDKILFNDFLKNEEIKVNNYNEVKRECTTKKNDGRMDLASINELEKTVVIIENKINSGLNGKKGENNGTQLATYYKNYYEDGYSVNGFIFVPDYNLKKLEIEIDKEENNEIIEKYKIIPYSKLLKYFKKFEKNEKYCKTFEDFSDYKYYEDFLSTLALHSKNSEEKMTEKFIKGLSKNNPKDIDYYVLVLEATVKEKDKNSYTDYYVETTNNIAKRKEELKEYKEKRKNNNAKYKNIENINPILEIKVNPPEENKKENETKETQDINFVFEIENKIKENIEDYKEKEITNQEDILDKIKGFLEENYSGNFNIIEIKQKR